MNEQSQNVNKERSLSVSEKENAVYYKANLRRREVYLRKELNSLSEVSLEEHLTPSLESSFEEQYKTVIKAMNGEEFMAHAVIGLIEKINSHLKIAKTYEIISPYEAALHYARAAQLQHIASQDPRENLDKANKFLEESRKMNTKHIEPNDLLADAVVLGILRDLSVNLEVPLPQEITQLIVNENLSLDFLKDYALVLSEQGRQDLINLFPESYRQSVSLLLDKSLSEVVLEEESFEEQKAIRERVKEAFFHALKAVKPGVTQEGLIALLREEQKDDSLNEEGMDQLLEARKLGSRWSIKQIVNTMTNLSDEDMETTIKEIAEQTTDSLKSSNNAVKKKLQRILDRDEMSQEDADTIRKKALASFTSFTARVLDTLIEVDAKRGGNLAMRYLEMTVLPERLFKYFSKKLIEKKYFPESINIYLNNSKNIPVLKRLMGKYGSQFRTIITTLSKFPEYDIVEHENELFEALNRLEVLTPKIFGKYLSKNEAERINFAQRLKELKPAFFRNQSIKGILDSSDEDILEEMVFLAYQPKDFTSDEVKSALQNLSDCTDQLENFNFPEDGYEFSVTAPTEKKLKPGEKIDFKFINQIQSLISAPSLAEEPRPLKESFKKFFESNDKNESVKISDLLQKIEGNRLFLPISGLDFVWEISERFKQSLSMKTTQSNSEYYNFLTEALGIFGNYFNDNYQSTLQKMLLDEYNSAEEHEKQSTTLIVDHDFREGLDEACRQNNLELIDWAIYNNSNPPEKSRILSLALTNILKLSLVDALLKQIRHERDKFIAPLENGESDMVRKLELKIGKNEAFYFSGGSVGLCTAKEQEWFETEGYFDFPIVENGQHVRGLVKVIYTKIDGKRALIVRQPTRNPEMRGRISVESWWEGIRTALAQFISENRKMIDVQDRFFIVEEDSWHELSNDTEVSEYLVTNYQKGRKGISQNIQVSSSHACEKIFSVDISDLTLELNKEVFVEITDLNEALEFIESIDFEEKYADWKTRIPKFLENYEGDWKLVKFEDVDGVFGFRVISNSKEKLTEWSNKFQSNGWIQNPIDLNTSVQSAYFYIFPEKRGEGKGTRIIGKMKESLAKDGIKTIYGFSRYPEVIPLYLRTGAKILNQERRGDEVRTYYYWEI